MKCLPLSFALLGIKIPRKKASSRNEGNINNENGNKYTKSDLIIPNSNSFELNPTNAAMIAYPKVSVREIFNASKGDVLRPTNKLFFRYSIIQFYQVDYFHTDPERKYHKARVLNNSYFLHKEAMRVSERRYYYEL